MSVSRQSKRFGTVPHSESILSPTGCVPKKIMWYTADMADNLRKAAAYGFGPEAEALALPKFNWTYLKHKRDAYIKRLNGI